MGMAVVRIVIDQAGQLSPIEYLAGLRRLAQIGHEAIASPPEHLPERLREIELIVPEGDDAVSLDGLAAACTAAFGVEAIPGVVTYISRGTDGDVHGVLRRFDIAGDMRRTVEGGEDVVIVGVARGDLARVPESRLHTALEAALNVEVRIEVRED